MGSFFEAKTILVFSPQPWNFLKISKHHYAQLLSEKNKVFFISAPERGRLAPAKVKKLSDRLFLLEYSLPVPQWFPFKLKSWYKKLVKISLVRLIKNHVGKADIAIDFGCYPFINSVKFFGADYNIFFPVDDFADLKGDTRGSDLVVTISENIQRKFLPGVCHFVNHGLSSHFENRAMTDLLNNEEWQKPNVIKAGYAGNLFLRFIDRELFQEIISGHPSIEFHFFGDNKFDPKNESDIAWNKFLTQTRHIFLHGVLSPDKLTEQYKSMDLFMLCYKPDHINYHGENSHKILEYLSMGKVTVSTYISYYSDRGLLAMPSHPHENSVAELFHEVVGRLSFFNARDKMNQRREFALDNTYSRQLNRIEDMIHLQSELK